MGSVTINVLCENTAGKTGLLGEHGLSIFIQSGKYSILFDTGAGYTLTHNATRLNLPLSSIKHLILSHGHYDHTGGMKKLFKFANIEKLFAHPNAFQKRYVKDPDSKIREIGYRGPTINSLAKLTKIIPVHKPTKIIDNIFASGPIPRTVPFELPETNFFSNIDTQELDSFQDDQCVFIERKDKVIVLLGCTHSGLINTLSYLQNELIRTNKSMIIIGGLHLSNASEERLLNTTRSLSDLNVEALFPCHCSGFRTVLFFNKNLDIPCYPAYAGFSINL